MRKIEDRETVYAEHGRLHKAITLAAVIRRHYHPLTEEVVAALPSQSWEWWVSLAREARCNPPSPATVESVVGLLAQEIPHDKHPADPLEGLPKP